MKSTPIELPADPTTFTIASMLAEWVTVPCTLCGIVGVTALLNHILIALNPPIVGMATTVLALTLAFAMGDFFTTKVLGI